MIENIKKYYLGSFIVFFIIFMVGLFITRGEGESITLIDIGRQLIAAVVAALIIGGIYHLDSKYHRPKVIRKIEKNLAALLEHGFKKEDSSYVGEFKKYSFIISPVFQSSRTDNLTIFTHVDLKGCSKDAIKRIKKSYTLINNGGISSVHLWCRYTLTALEVIAEIEKLIVCLNENDVQPMHK